MNLIIHCKHLRKTFFPMCKHMGTYLQHVERNAENKPFLDAFPEMIQTIKTCSHYYNIPYIVNRYEELIEYTVLKENRFRPAVLLEAYKALESPDKFSEEKWRQMMMLAWCIELIHSAMITQDDLWDNTPMRGKDISWHRKPNVGLQAINDGTLLFEGAITLIKKYFSSSNKYMPLMELIHDMNLLTSVGQSMDLNYKRDGKPLYETFNMDTYRKIAHHKAGVPLIAAPFTVSLIMTDNLSYLEGINDLLVEFGVSFQVDNDVLEIYDKKGNLKERVGNDIYEGKRTWIAVKILESGNEKLIEAFKRNYGLPERKCMEEVIKIIEEFDIYRKYIDFRTNTRTIVEERADRMVPSLRKAILSTMENMLPK